MQAQRRSLRGLITRRARVCGGSPTIAGTRVRVSDVVRYWRLHGDRVRIQKALPHLDENQIRAALDYYDAHKDEIEGEIKEEEVPASRAGWQHDSI